MKKIIDLIIIISLLLFNIIAVNAIPVPHGIEGIVYELDGITQVRKGVDFYIHNLDNDKIIAGKTGYGSSGRYSAALKGRDGDKIVVKAWNKYNSVNVTVDLEGVMYNVNLLLNMTYPPLAPNITSFPITNITEGSTYEYDVYAYDENEDVLNYSFLESPEGMNIENDNGKITWVPTDLDIGSHEVVVLVTDGMFNVTQSFDLKVIDVNHKPVINSTPSLSIKVGSSYEYDVKAYDKDKDKLTYRLLEYPNGMIIDDNGKVSWKPKGKDKGKNDVILIVNDSRLTDTQNFSIYVYSNEKEIEEEKNYEKKLSVSSGGGSGVIIKKDDEEERKEEKIKKRIMVKELGSRPDEVKKISRHVYKYLEIKGKEEENIIEFKVEKDWFDRLGVRYSDVVLSRFNSDEWYDLDTRKFSEDEEFAYYKAETPGFSYFAITVKEGIEVNNKLEPITSSVKEAFKIYGTVYLDGISRQAESGTKIIIENIDGKDKVEVKTGLGKDTGAYYTLIHGKKGDRLKITIENIDEEYFKELKDDLKLDLKIHLGDSGFSPITGAAIFDKELKGSPLIAAILGIIIIIIFIKFKYNKK